MNTELSVLFLEGIHPKASEVFAQVQAAQVRATPDCPTGDQLIAAARGVNVLGIRSRTQLNAEFFARAPDLRAVGCFCIGTNQVDLAAAARAGVAVFNAPYANTRSVAELALAEIIMLMRKIPLVNEAAHRGAWMKSAKSCYEVRGKKLGIIGYGRIGVQLGLLAEALGMSVLYYDVDNKLPFGNARACPQLAQLLAQADVVSLHVPRNASTNNMIDAAALAQMRPGSMLINAARGDIVNIPDLVQALDSGHIAGAALDVFPDEPASNKDPFVSELQRLPQVLLTPHIGGSTQEAQENIALDAATKLRDYVIWGQTLASVNFPEVVLKPHHDACRFLHIHQNRPGVLGAINEIFSNAKVNICGQFLQTRGDIGYVVTDVDTYDGQSCLDKELFIALKSIKHTIKVLSLSPLI